MNAPVSRFKTVLIIAKVSLCLLAYMPLIGQTQAWRNCIPDFIGPGGQHGYSLDCIGVFSDPKGIQDSFDSSYFTTEDTISNAHILRLWKKK